MAGDRRQVRPLIDFTLLQNKLISERAVGETSLYGGATVRMRVAHCVYATYTQRGTRWHVESAFIWQQQSLLSTEQCSFHAWTVRSWIKVAGAHRTHMAQVRTHSPHTPTACFWPCQHTFAGGRISGPRPLGMHCATAHNTCAKFHRIYSICYLQIVKNPKGEKMRIKLRMKCAGQIK